MQALWTSCYTFGVRFWLYVTWKTTITSFGCLRGILSRLAFFSCLEVGTTAAQFLLNTGCFVAHSSTLWRNDIYHRVQPLSHHVRCGKDDTRPYLLKRTAHDILIACIVSMSHESAWHRRFFAFDFSTAIWRRWMPIYLYSSQMRLLYSIWRYYPTSTTVFSRSGYLPNPSYILHGNRDDPKVIGVAATARETMSHDSSILSQYDEAHPRAEGVGEQRSSNKPPPRCTPSHPTPKCGLGFDPSWDTSQSSWPSAILARCCGLFWRNGGQVCSVRSGKLWCSSLSSEMRKRSVRKCMIWRNTVGRIVHGDSWMLTGYMKVLWRNWCAPPRTAEWSVRFLQICYDTSSVLGIPSGDCRMLWGMRYEVYAAQWRQLTSAIKYHVIVWRVRCLVVTHEMLDFASIRVLTYMYMYMWILMYYMRGGGRGCTHSLLALGVWPLTMWGGISIFYRILI